MTTLRVFIVPENASNGEWKAQFYSDDFTKLIFEKSGSVDVQCDPLGVISEGKIWLEKNKEAIIKELKPLVNNPELIFEN